MSRAKIIGYNLQSRGCCRGIVCLYDDSREFNVNGDSVADVVYHRCLPRTAK